jgi:hypothetical protein
MCHATTHNGVKITYSNPTSPARVPSRSLGRLTNGRALEYSVVSFPSSGFLSHRSARKLVAVRDDWEVGTKAEAETAHMAMEAAAIFMVLLCWE